MPPILEDRTPVSTYLPKKLVDQIDEHAAADGMSRAAWTRRQLIRAVREAADAAPPINSDQAAVLAAAGLARKKAS